MAKFRSALVVVVAILVSLTSAKQYEDLQLRVKRADSSALTATLNKLWQNTLIENLPLMSKVAGEILPSLSYDFLASPAAALEQVTRLKVEDLLDADAMLAVVADEAQRELIKADTLQIIKDSAKYINCSQPDSVDATSTTENVVALLTKFELLKMNRPADCFIDNGRYSGTDYENGTIVQGLANSIEDCQNSCIDEKECQFFVYFKEDHQEQEKRKVCRLLRFDGILEENQIGHKSGPKFCVGIFYPRVFAKKLRDFVIKFSSGYRAVQCRMVAVRQESKTKIDQMYYLRSQDRPGFHSSLDNYKCEICIGDTDCGDTEAAVDNKIERFFDHLISVGRNMAALLTPLEDTEMVTDNRTLIDLQEEVSDSLKATYFRDLRSFILEEEEDCVVSNEDNEVATTGDSEPVKTATPVSAETTSGVISEETEAETDQDDLGVVTTTITSITTTTTTTSTTTTTTTTPSTTTTTTTTSASASVSSTLLPLCSEVSSSSQLGSGLLSQFGISVTTSKPDCREDPSLSSSTTTTTTTAPTTTTGDLYQQLADKFGFGR
jgi:hypothetical protein